jgi:hypothetical protein
VIESGAFIAIAGKAASLGIVDSGTLKHIQENADNILKYPD